MQSYTAPAGVPIYGGRYATAPRPWAVSVPANLWTEVGSQTWHAFATLNIPGPETSYNGTGSAFAAMRDAYADPAFSADKQTFSGGGHGDGTCDAVGELDKATMTWALLSLPTPPSRRPPIYVNGNSGEPGKLIYPSGLAGNQVGTTGGHFLPAPPLTDPLDLLYANTLSRTSTHMYASTVMRKGVKHCFYLAYGEFDTVSKTWSTDAVSVRFGEQLAAAFPQFKNVPLQQGTVATWDEVTDRFFVTLNPGDDGGGWRNRMLVIDPTTRTIEAILNPSGMGEILNSVGVFKVGRKLYILLKTPGSSATVMNTGMILDMDTKVFRRFVIPGDPSRLSFVEGTSQETIPGWYDGTRINLWNYNLANRGVISSLNLTPSGGSGSIADPFVLQRTETVVANPPSPVYTYRLDFDQASGCVVFIPSARLKPVALRFVPAA